MSEQLHRPVSQGQVSRWLGVVQCYLKAGGILPEMTKLSAKPQAVDPEIIDMGKRGDHLTPRQRLQSDFDAE